MRNAHDADSRISVSLTVGRDYLELTEEVEHGHQQDHPLDRTSRHFPTFPQRYERDETTNPAADRPDWRTQATFRHAA